MLAGIYPGQIYPGGAVIYTISEEIGEVHPLTILSIQAQLGIFTVPKKKRTFSVQEQLGVFPVPVEP